MAAEYLSSLYVASSLWRLQASIYRCEPDGGITLLQVYADENVRCAR